MNGHTINFDKDLAPFVDVDNDGNYNPLNGDYPKIKGNQSIWWVMNDNGNRKGFGGNLETLGGVNGGEIGL